MPFTLGQKFNENTDWEFTVSNETIAEMVQVDGGITESDIAEYCYSALVDKRVYAMLAESSRPSNDGLYPWATDYCPAYNTNNGAFPSRVEMNTSVLESNKVTCYQRNILTYYGTIGGKTGHFLVMDIKDIKKWYIDYDTTGKFSSLNVSSTEGFPGISGTIYKYSDSEVKYAIVKPYNATGSPTGSLRVLNILDNSGNLWIGALNPSANSRELISNQKLSHAAWTRDYAAADTYNTYYSRYIYQGESTALQGWCHFNETVGDNEFPLSPGPTTPFYCYLEDIDGFNIVRVSGQYGNSQNPFITYCEQGCFFKDLNAVHTVQSWAGFLFLANNTLYKPIIEGGIIIGYTDDMDKTSDWDEMTNVTGNNISPVPPAPSAPTGDVETDMPLAYIGGSAGMVSFIKINASGLASADDIAESISRFDITTIGKDLLRNFVAFKCYAVLNIDDSVVRDIKVAGRTLKDEDDNALQGEYIGSVAPVDFTAGTVDHLYNDFRDYAPYTRIQMYVPFCGWFDLPSWCMGKEITGTMFTDIYNGTVKAVIYASRTVVAEVGGCCAFDIPFAAESTGMKAGAVISSALSTIAMTGATVAAPNIATGIAAVSSAANLVSAANSNGTTLKGVMGDGSNISGLHHVYIKTTRPKAPNGKKNIPEQYKHDFGIPCFKQLKLTAGDGFTQIGDANITGSMTDREKQMIIDGFRHGLIL